MMWLVIILGVVIYYTIGRSCQSYILTALSLYVYWQFGQWSIVPIVAMTIMFLIASAAMEKCRSKVLLWLPTMISITGFFVFRNNISNLVLPLGYSVMTFSGISLLIDQYQRGKRYNWADVASFLLFFPKIFAGPIERANDFITILPKSFNFATIYIGIKYLIFASFCKFIVSDFIVADLEHPGINLWFGIITYAITFFFDFWAYSLMAIGAGYMLGYHLSVSFDRPYYAQSLRDFWHRWNITLGTWLRDYIYIPLGGNRLKPFKQAGDIMLVFCVSGLWHGSSLPFICWGVMHGFMLCVERFLIKPERRNIIAQIFYAMSMFVIISLLWQLFVVDTMPDFCSILSRLLQPSDLILSSLYKLLSGLAAVAILTHRKVVGLISHNAIQLNQIITESTMLTLMLVALLLLNTPFNLNFFYFRF